MSTQTPGSLYSYFIYNLSVLFFTRWNCKKKTDVLNEDL